MCPHFACFDGPPPVDYVVTSAQCACDATHHNRRSVHAEQLLSKKESFMDERKRDSMIAYLRHRMDAFGIRPEHLASALALEKSEHTVPRYRSATGDEWNGDGEMP